MLLLRVVLIRPSSSSDINSMGFAPFDRKAESAPGCSLPLPQGSLLSTTSQSRQVLQSCFCGSCFCALQTQSRQVLQSCFCRWCFCRWLRRATPALAGRWRSLWGAAPPQLCHAASPLPQRQRPAVAFPRRPCTVSAYPGSAPRQLQCHGPGLQQVATSNGHDPGLAAQTPSTEAPGGQNPHLHRVSCNNIVQQQQQQPASSPWIVCCKGGAALVQSRDGRTGPRSGWSAVLSSAVPHVPRYGQLRGRLSALPGANRPNPQHAAQGRPL